MPRKFDPAGMKRLISEERRRETPPEEILEEIGIATGQTFVDIGAGPGFFALPAARRVGPRGRVLGFDISPAMLEALRANSRRAGLKNLRAVRASETATGLPPGADIYFMANVLHEVDDPAAYLRVLRRKMTGRSRLAIIDYLRKPTKRGPPIGERIPLSRIRGLLGAAGLDVERMFRPSAAEYGVLARRSRRSR